MAQEYLYMDSPEAQPGALNDYSAQSLSNGPDSPSDKDSLNTRSPRSPRINTGAGHNRFHMTSEVDRVLANNTKQTWTPLVRQMDSDSDQPKSASRKQIVLACCLICIPMFAFTGVIIWLIFGHSIPTSTCVHEELCLTSEQLNQTIASSHYIVNFPAAQLVFIASWSSTLSFALLGTLMTIYAYSLARDWLYITEQHRRDAKNPTPYQTSVIFGLINADMRALYDLFLGKIKSTFWMNEESGNSSRSPRILRCSCVVFVLGIIGSILIQAADTYLHITTEALDWVLIHEELPNTVQYGRGIDEWCFEQPTEGNTSNPNYWGCSMAFDENGRATSNDFSEAAVISFGTSKENEILHFQDDSGLDLVIAGPKNPESRLDWAASTFGVSTQCQAIHQSACTIKRSSQSEALIGNVLFDCIRPGGGQNISGIIDPLYMMQLSFLDWHRFISESPPFGSFNNFGLDVSPEMLEQAANLSDENATSVFRNPWHWIAFFFLEFDDPEAWQLSEYLGMMVFCNSTVWDLNYTSVNHAISKVDRIQSNSSTTGIANMMPAPIWNLANSYQTAALDMATYDVRDSPTMDTFISAYARASSRLYLSFLIAQCSPRPVLAAQSRTSSVVTKVPKTAVWILVTANLLFAFFGIVLTILALVANSPDVHQVQIRMNITGLAAQLFEGRSAQERAKNSKQLFEERDGEGDRMVKRVAVERTDKGGMTMSLHEGWEE